MKQRAAGSVGGLDEHQFFVLGDAKGALIHCFFPLRLSKVDWKQDFTTPNKNQTPYSFGKNLKSGG